MATIAIDARFYGTEHTGLGRYTTNVMAHLPGHLKDHKLKILLRRNYFSMLKFPSNCEKILCDIPHYSLSEQINLPQVLNNINPDLLYTFHFNTPVFSKVPTIITVHDLIKSYFTGADTTTRAPWLYALKRAGYNYTIKRALTQALEIVVPSNTVKNQILAHFPTIKPEHIHAIPEAPDPIFRSIGKNNSKTPSLPEDYLLFVGNAYPHKNLGILLDAVEQLPNEHLVIIAKDTPFLKRLLAGRNLSRIHLLSELSDPELISVYKNAKALITPSLMEGYGLVGLEALMVGTPVIASNIPVYREVYGDKVTYFDPHSSTALSAAISKLKNQKPVSKLNFARSWDDVATTIAEVINESSSRLRSSQ